MFRTEHVGTLRTVWCSRRFRDDVIGRLDHLHDDLIEIHRLITLDLGVDMAANDDLRDIIANQTEAASELSGLPAKIDELTAAVEAGQQVDPELLAAAKAGSALLASIVPNAPAEPEPTPEPETPVEETPAPAEETPAEPAPADEAPVVDEPTA